MYSDELEDGPEFPVTHAFDDGFGSSPSPAQGPGAGSPAAVIRDRAREAASRMGASAMNVVQGPLAISVLCTMGGLAPEGLLPDNKGWTFEVWFFASTSTTHRIEPI